MKNSLLIFASILSVSTLAQAEQNVPNFVGSQSIGRMQAFYSPKGLSWFLPLALSSDLSCSPASGSAKRSCTLKVMNSFNDQESAALTAFEASQSTKVVALSSTDAGIVPSVKEEFASLPTGMTASQMKLETLAVKDHGAYASVAFRGTADQIAKLEASFQNEGAGTFTSEVTIAGEEVGDYLAVNNPQVIKDTLGAVDYGVSHGELAKLLDNLYAKLSITANGYSTSEAKVKITNQIKDDFFKYAHFWSYRLDSAALAAMPATYVLRNESIGPRLMKCTVQLVLKAGSAPVTTCQEVEQ